MNNQFKQAIIDDVTPNGINEALQDSLLDLFEHIMKKVATAKTREAKFEASDFSTARESGCGGFTLLMKRIFPNSSQEWLGLFQRGEQQLEVIGHLE